MHGGVVRTLYEFEMEIKLLIGLLNITFEGFLVQDEARGDPVKKHGNIHFMSFDILTLWLILGLSFAVNHHWLW